MLNKLEIDVMQANELQESVQLTYKYKLPAMVVHQDLASEAFITRGRVGGKFKLITPIDWPKGSIFGMNKLRGLSTDALEVEGFEIMLTSGMTVTESRNEAKVFTDFIKRHLSETMEVRFVLGTQHRSEENVKNICEALVGVRLPAYVRNDTQLKLQISKANQDVHKSVIDMIHTNIRVPVKIGGNINSIRTMAACQTAARFAVNLLQAKAIVKEFDQQPDQLRQLLTNDAPSQMSSL